MDVWVAVTLVLVVALTNQIDYVEGMGLCRFDQILYEFRKLPTSTLDVTASPLLPADSTVRNILETNYMETGTNYFLDEVQETEVRTRPTISDARNVTNSQKSPPGDIAISETLGMNDVETHSSDVFNIAEEITVGKTSTSTDAPDVESLPKSPPGDININETSGMIDVETHTSDVFDVTEEIIVGEKSTSADVQDVTSSPNFPVGNISISKTSGINEETRTSDLYETSMEVPTPISSYDEEVCPPNMVNTTCTCQGTCADPNSCYGNCEEATACICPNGFLISDEHCINKTECACYMPEIGLIPEGKTYIDADCSVQCSCENNQLHCNLTYKCSTNAECRVMDNLGQCYCKDSYTGDGETCTRITTDCYDVNEAGFTQDGVYTILPSIWPGSPFNVSCDMTTSGGGWTVFQRRINGVTDFFQPWDTYKEGFGQLVGDFWLGNEKLHYITNQKDYRLRIDMITEGGSALNAEYSSFRIDNETNFYQIVNIGALSGNTDDGMAFTIGRRFSTYDKQQVCDDFNCPQNHGGAWWYASDWCKDSYSFFFAYCALFKDDGYRSCTYANLNGDFDGGDGVNIFWDIPGPSCYCSLTFVEMKIRPSY